ncbi:SMI1/KNR4 family protein [Nocardia sp. NPDC058658]|uniref:SMI1/KNR4 family protein n=1 Tax=Nocardia sp. NPDC058658 TaxID=3346580 RepID=UPI003646D9CE
MATTNWDVSCWNVAQATGNRRSGSAPDRDTAVRELITAGRAIARDESGVSVNEVVQLRLGNEIATVHGFDDPDLPDDELRRRIEAGIEAQKERTRLLNTPPTAPQATGPTMSTTQPSSVTGQWARIATWIQANLPSATVNGAEREEIHRTAEATGITWPEEFSTLFTHINGFSRENWLRLLPVHELFDLDRVVQERQLELDVWGEFDEEMGEPATAAGDPAGTYLPQFLPFAGLDGNLLFVDTRPGPFHGCITEFDKVGADDAGPRWASLSAMLADLAHSLETGTPFDQHWTPAVVAGELNWQFQP